MVTLFGSPSTELPGIAHEAPMPALRGQDPVLLGHHQQSNDRQILRHSQETFFGQHVVHETGRGRAQVGPEMSSETQRLPLEGWAQELWGSSGVCERIEAHKKWSCPMAMLRIPSWPGSGA